MTTWRIRLQGDTTDLGFLSRDHGNGPFRVLHEGPQGYFYESDSFGSLQTEGEVREQARFELASLSGLLKLHYDSLGSVTGDAVYKKNDDGTKSIYVHIAETIHVRDFMDARVSSVGADGARREVLNYQTNSVASKISASQTLAGADGAVQKALRLFGADDALSWVGLYRVYEVVAEDVGGQHSLAKKPWVSASLLNRFTHSANSPHVGGDSSRHAAQKGLPPSAPLALSEAISFIKQMTKDWLNEKGA